MRELQAFVYDMDVMLRNRLACKWRQMHSLPNMEARISLQVRITEELHKRLKALAKEREQTMRVILTHALDDLVSGDEQAGTAPAVSSGKRNRRGKTR